MTVLPSVGLAFLLLLFSFFSYDSFSQKITSIFLLFKRFRCRLSYNLFSFSFPCILLNIWCVLNTHVIYEFGFVMRLYFSSMM